MLKIAGKGKAGKKKKQDKSSKMDSDSEETCDNCGKSRHGKPDCFSKGGGKEGQAPCQKKFKKKEKTETAVVAVNEEKDKIFTSFAPQPMPMLPKLFRFQNCNWVLVWIVELAEITAWIAQSSQITSQSIVT